MPQTQPGLGYIENPDGSFTLIDLSTGAEVQEPRAGRTATGQIGVAEEGYDAGAYEVIEDTPERQIYRYGPNGIAWEYDKNTQEVREYTLQLETPETLRRVVQGMAYPFMDNPEGRENTNLPYMPVAAEATAAGLYGLYNLAAANSILPEFQNDYLDRASQRAMEVDERLRRDTYLTPPETPADFAAEIFGSLIVPAPKFTGGVSALTGRTGGLINNALEATTSGIGGANVFGRQGGAIHNIGSVITEAALPLRQGGLVSSTATQVPFGVGIMEGIDAAMPSDAYRGFGDALRAADRTDITPNASEQQTQDEIVEIDGEYYLIPASNEQLPLGQDYSDLQTQDTSGAQNLALTGLAGVAALGGGFALYRGIRHVTQQREAARRAALLGSTSLGGTETVPQYTDVRARLSGAIIQHDAPVRAALRDTLGPGRQLDNALALLDRTTTGSLGTRINRTLRTGEFPESTITGRPLAPLLEAYAADMDNPQWTLTRDGLLAESALDDFNRTGTQAAFNDKTPQELRAIARAMRNDPQASRYADLVQDQYRTLLDFQREQGLISSDLHRELTLGRPNYVHMSRALNNPNTVGGSGSRNSILGRVFNRGTEESSGVQTGAAADPIMELSSQYDQIIRRANANNARRYVIETLETNPALSQHIRRLPRGEEPASLENVLDYLVDGSPHYVKITDNAIYNALTMPSRLSASVGARIVGIPTKLSQFFFTGPGAPFFTIGRMGYDTLTGTLLRRSEMDLGVMNEISNAIAGRSILPGSLSMLDPTTWASAPIGGLRMLLDTIPEYLSNTVATQLVRENGALYNILGPQDTQRLQQRLAQWHASTIRSQGEEVGAFNRNFFYGDDPTRTAVGLTDVAPGFTARSHRRATDEAIKGGANLFEGILRRTGDTWIAGRASPIARTYMTVLNGFNEGFRYQQFATNRGRSQFQGVEGQQRLGARVRRGSSDPTQAGGSQAITDANRVVLYLNNAIQESAEIVRLLREEPDTFITNLATTLTGAVVLQYLAAANDPQIAEQLRLSTDEQNTGRILTFGNTGIAVPPLFRAIWGPVQAVFNEVTGINDGNFNPDIANALRNYFDEDGLGERGEASVANSLDAAWQSANPINLSSVPAGSAIGAAFGMDLGMTRYTGSPSEVRTQGIEAGFGGTGELAGDAIGATTMATLEALLTDTIVGVLRSAMDFDRAFNAGASTDEALETALSRMTDFTAAKTRNAPMLFQDYERVQSVNDTEFRLWYEKNNKMEEIRSIFRQDITQRGLTGDPDRAGQVRAIDLLPPEMIGTAMVPIGMVTNELLRTLSPLEDRMSMLREQTENVRNQYTTTIEERNRQQNELNLERRELARDMLEYTRIAEEAIREMIGDPSFTYQNFEVEEYRNIPYPPVPVQ